MAENGDHRIIFEVEFPEGNLHISHTGSIIHKVVQAFEKYGSENQDRFEEYYSFYLRQGDAARSPPLRTKDFDVVLHTDALRDIWEDGSNEGQAVTGLFYSLLTSIGMRISKLNHVPTAKEHKEHAAKQGSKIVANSSRYTKKNLIDFRKQDSGLRAERKKAAAAQEDVAAEKKKLAEDREKPKLESAWNKANRKANLRKLMAAQNASHGPRRRKRKVRGHQ